MVSAVAYGGPGGGVEQKGLQRRVSHILLVPDKASLVPELRRRLEGKRRLRRARREGGRAAAREPGAQRV